MSKGMESIGQNMESSFKGVSDSIQMFLHNQNGAGGGGSGGGGGGDGGGKGASTGGEQGDKFNPISLAQNIAEGLKKNIYA